MLLFRCHPQRHDLEVGADGHDGLLLGCVDVVLAGEVRLAAEGAPNLHKRSFSEQRGCVCAARAALSVRTVLCVCMRRAKAIG